MVLNENKNIDNANVSVIHHDVSELLVFIVQILIEITITKFDFFSPN